MDVPSYIGGQKSLVAGRATADTPDGFWNTWGSGKPRRTGASITAAIGTDVNHLHVVQVAEPPTHKCSFPKAPRRTVGWRLGGAWDIHVLEGSRYGPFHAQRQHER